MPHEFCDTQERFPGFPSTNKRPVGGSAIHPLASFEMLPMHSLRRSMPAVTKVSRPMRRWLAFVMAIVVVAVMGLRRNYFPGRSFDPVGWGDESLAWNGVRMEMADRLIAQGLLVGKTRAE